MSPHKCTGTSAACSTPLLPRLQRIISPAPCKPAPPGGHPLNERGGAGGPCQVLRPDPQFVSHSHTQSFRKSRFYLQNTRQADRDRPPPLLPRLAKPPASLPWVVAAAPCRPSPRPHCHPVCSPPGSQAVLLKLGLKRAVGSKPSKDSLFHLQPSPAVGPQAFHDLQPTPSSRSHLAPCSSPMFLFVRAHSHLRGLACAVPPGAMLFSRFHMAPSFLRSAQMSPSRERSLITLFKTAALPCRAVPPGHRPSEFHGKARKQGT